MKKLCKLFVIMALAASVSAACIACNDQAGDDPAASSTDTSSESVSETVSDSETDSETASETDSESTSESDSETGSETEDGGKTEETKYTLTVVGGTGSGEYVENTKVQVTAEVPSGKIFVAWKLGNEVYATTETCEVTVNADITLTAEYEDGVTLTVVGGTGSGIYKKGSTVEVTPNTDAGKRFISWNIGGEVAAEYAIYSFTLTEDTTITAVFQNVYQVTVVGGTGSGEYAEGDIATVTASVPNAQYFKGWKIGGEYVSKNATYAFEVTGDVELTAEFGEFTLFEINYDGNDKFADGSASFTLTEGGDFLINNAGLISAKGMGSFEYSELSFIMYGMDNYGDPSGNFRVYIENCGWMFYYSSVYGFAGLFTYDGEWNADGTPLYRPDASQKTKVRIAIGDGTVTLYCSVMGEDGTFGAETEVRTITANKVSGSVCLSSYASLTYVSGLKASFYSVPASITVDGGTGSGEYPVGSQVSVKANVPNGKVFCGWKIGDTVVSYEKDFLYTVEGDAQLVAEYKDGVLLTVEGADGTGYYLKDSEVTLTAPEKSGLIFKGWKIGDDIVSEDKVYSFTISGEMTVSAIYENGNSATITINDNAQFTADSPKFDFNGNAFVISNPGLNIYELAEIYDISEISFIMYGMDNYGDASGNLRIRLGADGEGGWMFYYSPFYHFGGIFTYDGEWNNGAPLVRPAASDTVKVRLVITEDSVSMYYSIKDASGNFGAETLLQTLNVAKKELALQISSYNSCVKMDSFEIKYSKSATVTKPITSQDDFTADSPAIDKKDNGDLLFTGAGLAIYEVKDITGISEISFTMHGMDNYGDAGGNFRVRLGADGEGCWMFYYSPFYHFGGIFTYDGEWNNGAPLVRPAASDTVKVRLVITEDSVSMYYSIKDASGNFGAETLLQTLNVAHKDLTMQISSYGSHVFISNFTVKYTAA